MFLIPEGFAHGYCVLSEEAEVLYKCSTVYDAGLESEFAWNDPQVGVEWPVSEPLLSERDKKAQSFAEYLEKVKR
jgi:dTDP-4-dehydrorhamnose 3,5-epimerase